MTTNIIEKPLHVGKTDSYSLTVSPAWLNGEAISTATVTTTAANITSGVVSIVDNVLFVFLTGVEKIHYSDVHFEYATVTRSDCDSISVIVDDC